MTTENQITNKEAIRRANIADSENLATLARKAFNGYPFEYVFNQTSVAKALENGEARYVILGEDNTIAGSAVLGVSNEYMAEIMRVMIDPPLRKNGAATSLTRELSLDAIKLEKYTWADVRGDQIGMQRAALGSGLRAISLELGKHVVYEHRDETGVELGAARETMVHMTTLPIDEIYLQKQIANIPPEVLRALAYSLEKSFNPRLKDLTTTRQLLPSALDVKQGVVEKILQVKEDIDAINVINDDILQIAIGDTQTIVVLPDKSAFMDYGSNISKTLGLLEYAGIQVTTLYSDMDDALKTAALSKFGLTPTAIRPWMYKYNKVAWQIAWKKTSNGFENCLHPIVLDRIVERQMIKLINLIKQTT